LIFNRWGEVIFESKDTEQGWDGSYNGTLVQSGTYTWKISLKSKNNDDRKIIVGNLTVIR
jgi:gliding motility-associated-like protein